MSELEGLNYPKQYIFLENENTKIYKKIGENEGAKAVDSYLGAPITTITEKKVDGVNYYLIQYEDERLGWVNLKNSIQIFRFEPEVYRFIDSDFKAHDINFRMGLKKDFQSHFKGKLLNVKSEIKVNGERLLSIFIKNKFYGFHSVKNFEKMIETDLDINKDLLKDKQFYKVSSLQKPIEKSLNFENPKLVVVFKKNKIGKIRVNNKEVYWTELNGLENLIDKINNPEEIEKSKEQKFYDDIVYGLHKEREQSKEIVKIVLSGKEYLDAKRNNKLSSFQANDNGEVKELREELRKSDKQRIKIEKELKLNQKRLEQQKDYNSRLEAQKNKYKERMQAVEEKMKKLLDKKPKA